MRKTDTNRKDSRVALKNKGKNKSRMRRNKSYAEPIRLASLRNTEFGSMVADYYKALPSNSAHDQALPYPPVDLYDSYLLTRDYRLYFENPEDQDRFAFKDIDDPDMIEDIQNFTVFDPKTMLKDKTEDWDKVSYATKRDIEDQSSILEWYDRAFVIRDERSEEGWPVLRVRKSTPLLKKRVPGDGTIFTTNTMDEFHAATGLSNDLIRDIALLQITTGSQVFFKHDGKNIRVDHSILTSNDIRISSRVGNEIAGIREDHDNDFVNNVMEQLNIPPNSGIGGVDVASELYTTMTNNLIGCMGHALWNEGWFLKTDKSMMDITDAIDGSPFIISRYELVKVDSFKDEFPEDITANCSYYHLLANFYDLKANFESMAWSKILMGALGSDNDWLDMTVDLNDCADEIGADGDSDIDLPMTLSAMRDSLHRLNADIQYIGQSRKDGKAVFLFTDLESGEFIKSPGQLGWENLPEDDGGIDSDDDDNGSWPNWSDDF